MLFFRKGQAHLINESEGIRLHVSNSFDNLTVFDLLLMFKKRLRMIVVVTLVVAVLVTLLTAIFRQPEYTAKATIVVNPSQVLRVSNASDGQDMYQLSQMLLNTYASVMESNDIAVSVIHNLGLEDNVSQLQKNIKIEMVASSEVININVTYKNPQQAVAIENSVLSLSNQKIKVIYPGIIAETVSTAKVSEPYHSHLLLYMLLGVFAGLIIALLLAFAAENLDVRVQSENDIERLDMHVIGVIPKTR